MVKQKERSAMRQPVTNWTFRDQSKEATEQKKKCIHSHALKLS